MRCRDVTANPGGLNGLTQHSTQTHISLKTKSKSTWLRLDQLEPHPGSLLGSGTLFARTVSPMTTVTIPILATLFSLTIVAAQDIVPIRKLPLVRIVETSIDLHPSGITANSCIAIQSNGSFHLETRLQQLPRLQAVLHIYEATLDAFQLSRLERMLDAQAVRDASTYKAPKIPMVVATFANVRIDIARADRVQTVGYFAWNQQPGTDGLSPSNPHQKLSGEEWRSSRLALTPLIGWFHEVEAVRWPELDESRSTPLRPIASTDRIHHLWLGLAGIEW